MIKVEVKNEDLLIKSIEGKVGDLVSEASIILKGLVEVIAEKSSNSEAIVMMAVLMNYQQLVEEK